MSMSPRPRATAIKPSKSMSRSENSHSSESAVSQPGSTSSANTSWATHFPLSSNISHAVNPLQKGADTPQVLPPTLEHDAVSPSPNAKRKARVLRKSPPPTSFTNGGTRRWNLFHTPARGPPSRSPPRVRINLNDDASYVMTGAVRRFSLPASEVLPPPSSYGVSRRSRSPLDNPEVHSIGRSVSAMGHAAYASDHVTDSPDAMSRLRAELSRVEYDGMSHIRTEGNVSNAPTVTQPAFRRNKPLPDPPFLRSDPLTGPRPMGLIPSRPRLSYRHSSYSAPSEEEQAESRFGHFSSGPNTNSGSPYEHGYASTPYTSWSDVGHAQTCSDMGHPTPAGSHARLAANYHATDPNQHQSQQHPESPHFASHHSSFSHPLSTTAHTRSSFAAFPTPLVSATRSSHSVSMYASRPPKLRIETPPPLTHRLSLGKRIKRTLSITLFRRDPEAVRTTRDVSYSESDPGHGSAYYGPASLAPSLTPWPQHEPQDHQQYHGPRKLKKRAPSLSSSLASTSVSRHMSSSTPALHPHLSVRRGHAFEVGVPFQDGHSEPELTPKPSPKKRSKSTPTRHRSGTLPPMPPLPGHDHSMPNITARETQSQPATPTSSSARKLIKRHAQRKKVDNPVDEHLDSTPPPPRSQSPLDLDLIAPRFSDSSRSHSTPNLGPSASGPGNHLTARYFDFTTESPPASPQDGESPVDVRPRSESHQTQQSEAHTRPSFLRSQSNRRWTLAVSEAPEEQLVEELDRLRSVGWGLGFQGELVRVKGGGSAAAVDGANAEEQVAGAHWGKEELEEWLVARKALMVCREIVRTEKSYREGLVRLQRGETLKAPPPLLLQYLPALISASEEFSTRLDDDPSAWGVSVAWLGTEEALEVALVAWSGVVGEFFGTSMGKQRRRSSTDYKINEKEKKGKEKERKMAGLPALPPSVGHSEDGHGQFKHVETKSVQGSWRLSMPALSQMLTSSTDISPLGNRKSRYSTGSIASMAATKTPTVQDLAIQPTQRVMRYVLLYKDLLSSTPITSPARVMVERALEGATRIAQRCNRAQDNAAFLT